jgi:hypothetical protein
METMDRSLRRLTRWTRDRPSRSPSPPDDDLSLSLSPSPTTPCTAPAPSLQRSPTLQSCDARLEEANRKVAQTHRTLASAFQTWAGAEARVGQSYLEVARNVLRAAHSHQRYHQRYYHDQYYDYQQQQQDAAGPEDEALGVMLPKLCEGRPEPGSAVREAAGEIVAGTATAERVAAYEAFLVLERRVVETKLDTLAARRMLLEAREVRRRRMSALSAVRRPLSFLSLIFSLFTLFFFDPVLLPCWGVGGESTC